MSQEKPNEIVKLISITPNIENTIVFCARTSNPSKQNDMSTAPQLIKYMIEHGHWSPFELGNLVIEVNTSRAISQQILRHRSFSFQERSTRYMTVDDKSGLVIYAARRQDTKNRQNSIDDLPDSVKEEWAKRQLDNWKSSFEHYKWALDNGIAKECARMVLPLQTSTQVYMNGTIRSWIHYLMSRTEASAQKEHRDIAELIKSIFVENLPEISKALGWL